MTNAKEHGPDNPREWDPDDPLLTSLDAPHETGGLLRMQRNGIQGKDMMRMLRMRGTEVMEELRHNMDAESDAAEAGVDIHDPVIEEEAT